MTYSKKFLVMVVILLMSCCKCIRGGGRIIIGHIINRWFGMDTITLGNAIFAKSRVTDETIYDGLRHVNQYRSWGIAFLPTYVGRYLIEVTNYYFTNHVLWGHFGYCSEWFEIDAYKAEHQKYPNESLGCTY